MVNLTNDIKEVLRGFANRKRIHGNKPMLAARLTRKLHQEGLNVSRLEIERLFLDLETSGYGAVIQSRTGSIWGFKPNKSIKLISKELLSTTVEKKTTSRTVDVYFEVGGKTCKAVVPIDILPEFTRSFKT